MPGPPDFQRVERVGVSNSVQIGFSFGGEAGVKTRFLAADREDSNPSGEMKVKGFCQSGGRMKGGNFARGDLAEGVNPAIGPTRPRDRDRLAKDFEKSLF